jgi:hypothetical protein
MRLIFRIAKKIVAPKSLLPTLAVILAAAFLSGCVSHKLAMESPSYKLHTTVRSHIVLKTVGLPGQVFNGTLTIDGKTGDISGVSPVEFPLDVCLMTGTLNKVSGDGTLSFEIVHDQNKVYFGSLMHPGSHLRFGYHDNGVECVQP